MSTAAGSLSDWFALHEIGTALVNGSVEDERNLLAVNNIKSHLRNGLKGEHLDACIRTRQQQFFTLTNFSCKGAVKARMARASQRGRNMA